MREASSSRRGTRGGAEPGTFDTHSHTQGTRPASELPGSRQPAPSSGRDRCLGLCHRDGGGLGRPRAVPKCPPTPTVLLVQNHSPQAAPAECGRRMQRDSRLGLSPTGRLRCFPRSRVGPAPRGRRRGRTERRPERSAAGGQGAQEERTRARRAQGRAPGGAAAAWAEQLGPGPSQAGA